jgi:hypothetical protein
MKQNKKPMQEIKYNYFHWGPFLFHTKVLPEHCKIVLTEGERCRKKENKYNENLAGHIKEEYKLDNPQLITDFLVKYLEAYTVGYNKWRGEGSMEPNFRLASLWINYMKAGEFNPPHDHGADLSFVLFPQVPEELRKECEAFEGTMRGPGGICWFYGEGDRSAISTVHQFPETGDLFIFPARLKHWVFPFKSDVTRISMSGNIMCEQDSRMNYFGKKKEK